MVIQIVNDPDGDWVGLYADGELKFEGHSLNGNQALEALSIPFQRYEVDVQVTNCSCPQRFEDIPDEAFLETS